MIQALEDQNNKEFITEAKKLRVGYEAAFVLAMALEGEELLKALRRSTTVWFRNGQ